VSQLGHNVHFVYDHHYTWKEPQKCWLLELQYVIQPDNFGSINRLCDYYTSNGISASRFIPMLKIVRINSHN